MKAIKLRLSRNFSVTFLTVSLAAAMTLLVFFTGYIWEQYTHYTILHNRSMMIQKLSSDLVYYDEARTMSARMAALTGDFSWEDRYLLYEKQLDEAVKEAAGLSPETFIREATDTVDQANKRLVEMEKLAFSLVHRGNGRQASTLLMSELYQSYKMIYKNGIQEINTRLRADSDENLATFRRQTFTAVPAGVVVLLILFFIMIGGTRVLKGYIGRITQAGVALQELNKNLEARVAKRTDELSRSNDSLNAELAERRAVEERLLRAERLAAVGTLTAGIAHQFNNITTLSLGYLQILVAETGLPAHLKKYLDALRKAIDRAVGITSRLLVLSAPPAAALSPVLVGDVVRAALPTLLPDIEREGATPTVELKDTRPIFVDRAQLDFVVRALVDNARHALLEQPRRELRVETKDDGEQTCLRVMDTGIGIARESRSSLFAPFFSGKGEHAPPGSPQVSVKGVGLSLTVVHAIVAGCGGRIDVESAPGAGSTFTVWFPTRRTP